MKKSITENNIVVAVLYAIVVSILGSNVASTSLGANADIILLAFSAFCFYTGYLFDDLKQETYESICPWVVSAWACFIIQATTIQRPVWSAFFGAVGLSLITIGMLFDYSKARKTHHKSSNRKNRWIIQNTIAFLFLVVYIIIKIPFAKLMMANNIIQICTGWHRIVLLIMAAFVFVALFVKLTFPNTERGED